MIDALPQHASPLVLCAQVSFQRIFAGLVCSLGGLIFGYDLGALSTTAPRLHAVFHLSAFLFGLTVASSLWGTVCGSIAAGRIGDEMGSSRLVVCCAALYLTSAGLFFFPFSVQNWFTVACVRFFCGASIGGLTVGCPLYLAEIAPSHLRGIFVGVFQFVVGVGVLAAFGVGIAGAHLGNGELFLRVCLGLGALAAALLLTLAKYMRPAPGWLARRSRWREADQVAHAFGFAEAEWPRDRMTDQIEENPKTRERLFSRKYMRPLMLATSIALFNQLSGVNILLLYLLDVLSNAGINEILSHRYTLVISAFSLALTFVSMLCVDRFGRKPLVIAGSAGMCLCLVSLAMLMGRVTVPWWYVTILVAYNGFFAFSQGAIIWIYLSELFPFGVRGAGQGYGVAVHWIANAVLVLLFPTLQRMGPTLGFYLFASMMALQVIVVYFVYPETKGTAIRTATGPGGL